jgi:hypothetical protein
VIEGFIIFSTWGTENSLAEINLESTGGDKRVVTFLESKIGKHLQLCGRARCRATRKNLNSRTQLDEPVECASASGGAIHYSFIKFSIYCFSLWYEFFVHYALRVEKNFQYGLDAGPLEFQFLRPRGCLTKPSRTLSFCFGVIGKKIPGLISRNNCVKKGFLSAPAIAIISWQDVTRSSLCSRVKECGTKHAHSFLFPKSSFRIRRTTVLGMFKDSAIVLDAIQRSFLDQISKSSIVYFSSSRFWTATSPVIFYQLPSVLKSRIPLKIM